MTLMTHVFVFLMSHLYHITLQIPFPPENRSHPSYVEEKFSPQLGKKFSPTGEKKFAFQLISSAPLKIANLLIENYLHFIREVPEKSSQLNSRKKAEYSSKSCIISFNLLNLH